MTPRYFVHFNHDYHEWMTHHATLAEAFERIRREMEIEEPITDPDFNDLITEEYEADSWKGLTIHAFTATGQLKEVGIDELRAELANSAMTRRIEAFTGLLDETYEPGDHENNLRLALTDLRLFADHHGLDFYRAENASYGLYMETKQEVVRATSQDPAA